MISSRSVLWVDCCGGLAVGLAMFAVSEWLSDLYRLPREVVLGIATANVAYGCFSLWLAIRATRPVRLIMLLALANAAWAALCGVAAIALWGKASAFGLAQFVLEALFVGWLAQLEWRQRNLLSAPASDRAG